MLSSFLLKSLPPNFFEETNQFPESPPPSLHQCCIVSPGIGAICGLAFYGLKRLSIRVGFVQGNIGSPLPSVLFGAVYMFIIEGARLAHATAVRILGNREEHEKLISFAQLSVSDRLRQRSWKVISCMEELSRAVDTVFSRMFHIRSTQEIKDQRVPDKDLRFIEIVRRCFIEQLSETINMLTPIILADKAVKLIGYQFLAVNAFRWFGGGVLLTLTLVNKVQMFYLKREYKEWLREKNEFYHGVYDNMLDIMYPAEVEAIKVRRKKENNHVDTESIIVLDREIEARKPSKDNVVNEQDFNHIINIVDSYLRPHPL